jgi:hypothetical protein
MPRMLKCSEILVVASFQVSSKVRTSRSMPRWRETPVFQIIYV